MEVSVRQINIKPKYVRTLLAKNIVLASHLNVFNSKTLALRTNLTHDECDEILAATKPKRPHHTIQASEFMINPFDNISTTLEALDDTLGGGIRCGQITEISGEAGAGKSNLVAHIGMKVMMPKDEGGADSSILIIHTEGEGKLTLTLKRYKSLAISMLGKDELSRTKLHVTNCSNEFELAEMVNRLPNDLKRIKDVKMVVIDSITCAFIQTEGDLDFNFYMKRNIKLTEIIKALLQIAWDRRIAIVITNHVSYNMKLGETRPAMGRLWSHLCQTKVYLERKNTIHGIVRYAHVTKGALTVPMIAQFRISDRIQN